MILHEKLRIFNINIRSLRKHFDELVVYLNSSNFTYDVIVLTEVWIKSGEEGRFGIPGYDLLLQDRPDNQAGGVVIYVNSALSYSHNLILLPTAELINVIINLSYNNRSYKLSLFGIYRQCKFTYNKFKDDFERLLGKCNDPTIFIGDFNLCLLKNTGSKLFYLNLISSYGFESLVNEPTRVVNESSSCLDHVLVRNSSNLEFEYKVHKLNITDHYGISVFIRCNKISSEERFFKVLDKDLFRRRIVLSNWNSIMSCNDVNTCVDNFYNIYQDCYNSSCYLKKVNSNNRKRSEWINEYLIRLINQKNNLYKAYSKNRENERLKKEYKSFSNMVCKKIKQAKLNYYSSLIEKCDGNSKEYWKVIKKIVKNKKKSFSSIKVDNILLQSDGNEVKIANAFNKYFTGVVPKLRQDEFGQDLFIEDDFSNYDVHLSFFDVTDEEVVDTIKCMKNKRSVGVDGISMYVIKNNLDVFAPLVCKIVKESLVQGVFPDKFKVASVVPIFKAGDMSEVSSYRPISVINTIAKILESVIKAKLLKYLHDRNILSENQYGFLPGKGTDLAIERHISEITKAVDKRKYTLSIYLDFQKAFDVLDHNILFCKLRKYGVGNRALDWFKSFCTGRKQVVKINGHTSDVLELKYGTPQGGVLGPIIFLIYVNDLLNINLHSRIFAYADDTAIVCSSYSRESLKMHVNSDLEKISRWLVNNRLVINCAKSKCILFFDHGISRDVLRESFNFVCHRHQCIYKCECSNIEIVTNVKYLGVLVDEHLKWEPHISYLCAKLRKINYALYFLRDHVKSLYLKKVYVSWFESVLRYGIMHFGGTYATLLKPVIMCQRHALRTIFSLKRCDSMSHLFIENNLLTFNQLHVYSILMYVKKFIYLFNLKPVSRLTRSAQYNLIKEEFFTKETTLHQFCSLGPKFFNKFARVFGNQIYLDERFVFKRKVLQYVLNYNYE
jgi:uncharacterized protein YktA (UPF0223 family)